MLDGVSTARRVVAIILHPEPGPGAGPLTTALAVARRVNAGRLASTLGRLGAEVRLVAGPSDDLPYGARIRGLMSTVDAQAGVILAGSGAVPLATAVDLRRFVETAGSVGPAGLANNRHSADIVALAPAAVLRDLPDLASDNALPRWLAEVADVPVADLRARSRMGVDLDSPLDVVLVGGRVKGDERVLERLAAVRAVAADASKELLVAGRTSAGSLAALERRTACRVRALVEERGLRTARPGQRPPRSVLGLLLDRDGPGALGRILLELGDAAVIDSRVLLAHRLGTDESAWPIPEDRFAADLLLAERIADSWLRDLAAAARDAPIPVILGGHTAVGPGLPRLLGQAG